MSGVHWTQAAGTLVLFAIVLSLLVGILREIWKSEGPKTVLAILSCAIFLAMVILAAFGGFAP